ncbi:MAG: Fmu (Sun) domain protein, partial [Bacteroidota bacterium]
TEYSKTQSTILSNVSRAVLSGSYLVYMTCSVFAMENEQVVSSLIQGSDYHLIAQKMLKGYEHGCDSLFVAVLRKN